MFEPLLSSVDLSPTVYLLLFAVAGLAGFVDAIAGGGGLLTLPMLLKVGLPEHLALATNKGQSVFGSGMALGRYAHSPLLDRRRAVRSFVPALLGAAAGAYVVTRIEPAVLRPVIIVLLGAVALWMIFHQQPHVEPEPRRQPFITTAAVAFLIAFYDGFFGPGTGTFLIMAYAYLWRDSLDVASANAKVVNFASNLASVVMFAWRGLVLWHVALPMAAGQAVGGYFGAHLTTRVGRSLVRYVTVAVSLALLTKLGWDFAVAEGWIG